MSNTLYANIFYRVSTQFNVTMKMAFLLGPIRNFCNSFGVFIEITLDKGQKTCKYTSSRFDKPSFTDKVSCG